MVFFCDEEMDADFEYQGYLDDQADKRNGVDQENDAYDQAMEDAAQDRFDGLHLDPMAYLARFDTRADIFEDYTGPDKNGNYGG